MVNYAHLKRLLEFRGGEAGKEEEVTAIWRTVGAEIVHCCLLNKVVMGTEEVGLRDRDRVVIERLRYNQYEVMRLLLKNLGDEWLKTSRKAPEQMLLTVSRCVGRLLAVISAYPADY